MKHLDKELSKLEELVRAGDFTSVKKALHDINTRTIRRENLVRYANIANRVDQPRFAHRILQGIVRANKPLKISASESEKIEYAEALRLMGLTGEAKKILNEVDFHHYPIVHLRMAFCLIIQWKYAEAIPYLRRFISAVDPQEYLHLVARVNLAACFVRERMDTEALTLLDQLVEETRRENHRLLNGNCLELTAQLFIRQKHYARADRALEEAMGLMGSSTSRFSLYLRKWKAISQSLQTNSIHPDLVQCRKTASEDMDWETVRDCDLYIGLLSKNQSLLQYVYFGTPHKSYRKRMVELLGDQFAVTESYVWNPNQSSTTEVFDLIAGRDAQSKVHLEIGHLTHRLFILLCSDFYRPLSVCTAFSELFPEENFSQSGSANRVSQIVKRLRAWFHETGDHFTIEEQDGYYRLRVHENAGILVPREMPSLSLQSVTWKKMSCSLQSTLFSKHDVIKNLECSKASAERLLRWAVDSGQIAIIGDGPQRKYRLAG